MATPRDDQPMGVGQYLKIVASLALRKSLDAAQTVVFIGLIAVGIFAAVVPKWIAPQLPDMSGWVAAAFTLGSIVAFRLVAAPYWIWREQNRQLRSLTRTTPLAFAAPTSDLTLTFDPLFAIGGDHGPGLYRAHVVMMRNTGHGKLDRCQLRLFIYRQDNTLVSPQRLYVCPPQTLRSGEQTRVGIFDTPFDQRDGSAVVRPLVERDGAWGLNPSFPTLSPGTYRIEVQGLSDDTAASTLALTLFHDEGGWNLRPS
jgi:hypothetical protein